MVFSATRSLCRKLSKRYDVNASYLFFPPPSPFFFLSLINLKLRGRIVPFDRAIHVHPLSISLAISFFASLAPLLDAISLDRNRGWDLSYKNWQELVLLAPLSRDAIHRAVYASERSDKWGGNLLREKVLPLPTMHFSFESIANSANFANSRISSFFDRKVFRSKPI